jgi:hypothetical protein
MGHKPGGDCLQNVLPRSCCYFKVAFAVCFGLNGRSARMCQLDAGTRDPRAGHIGYRSRDCRNPRLCLSIPKGRHCDDECGKQSSVSE